MDGEALRGYRGRLKEALEETGTDIGDLLRVEAGGRIYEGILMPRLESADDRHLVITLRSGYNIGVAFDGSTRVERLGAA
ncbi:MAG: Glu-tRNA(Gln) amidotransferase GatDE subunit D, partial [Candidatus Bathyarchaeota archaeon]|nr:Glu-tRNA(Gln) amidotransferase GatDE subunit D [Candidatus Bathyarchaeota archaeon]